MWKLEKYRIPKKITAPSDVEAKEVNMEIDHADNVLECQPDQQEKKPVLLTRKSPFKRAFPAFEIKSKDSDQMSLTPFGQGTRLKKKELDIMSRLGEIPRKNQAKSQDILKRLGPLPNRKKGLSIKERLGLHAVDGTRFVNHNTNVIKFKNQTTFLLPPQCYNIDQMKFRAERLSPMDKIRARIERFEEETAPEIVMVKRAEEYIKSHST